MAETILNDLQKFHKVGNLLNKSAIENGALFIICFIGKNIFVKVKHFSYLEENTKRYERYYSYYLVSILFNRFLLNNSIHKYIQKRIILTVN